MVFAALNQGAEKFYNYAFLRAIVVSKKTIFKSLYFTAGCCMVSTQK